MAVIVRPWLRVREATADDDNPDIMDCLGHGDLTVVWAPGRHQLSLGTRLSVRTGRSAMQSHWTFHPTRRVRGMAQWSGGYGERLVDHNRRQDTQGFGIALADHL